ncbi:MAG: hypothetical protein JSV65_16930, partial [Armatimonadota bacterium]
CRNVTPKDCAIRIADAFAQLARIPGCQRYLKLDSTLRGNIGAAIEAATEVAGAPMLAPAFPARRRTVADGVLLVNGTPVAETEVGRDGAAPVSVSEVAAIVRRQWQCGVAILSPRTYGTPGALAEALAQALNEGAELLVIDADSAEDMRDIAAAVQHMSEMSLHVLPAGSAGLARGFADVMGVSPRTPPPSPPARAMPMPVLAVVGSRTQVASAQIEALARAGVQCLPAGDADVAQRAAAMLSAGLAVAIVPGASDHRVVARTGAETVACCGEIGLVLSGGATARRLCELARIEHLWIVGELQPGVAAGRAVTPEADTMPLVIKGGAAGDAMALVAAIHWIRGEVISAGGTL